MKPILTLRIDSLAFGGNGVGRSEGKVCFVPYSAPGDVLSVRVSEDHGSYLVCDIVELREPGPSRRQPRCSHFGRCGGCSWQHVDYAAQLAAKRNILVDAMVKIGGIEPPIRPIIASAQEYGYRTRTRLHVRGSGVGYFERQSTRIVEISECPILAPQLEARLGILRGSVRPRRERARASSSGPKELEIELRATDSERVVERSLDSPDTHERGAGHRSTRRQGDDEYAFHQVNRFVNGELSRTVAEAIAERAAGRRLDVIDLYCGNGNLSLPLAPGAVAVNGFDTAEESIRQAAEAARSAGLEQARYACLDAASGIQMLTVKQSAPAIPAEGILRCVIADPPRSGLKEVARAILAIRPELFIYVSCNPPALARDSRRLLDGAMSIDYLQPLDMFPQTSHLETVAVFAAHRR